MSDNLSTGIVSVLLAIIGVATLAAILAPKAQTSQVITAGGNAVGNDILAALSPLTGTTPNLSSNFSSMI